MSPRNPGAKNKTKVTVWLPDGSVKDLKRLQRSMGKESLSEVIRDAVMVYADLLKARDKDVDLYFQDSKTGKSSRVWILPTPLPVPRRED
jgi:hypothetical protein